MHKKIVLGLVAINLVFGYLLIKDHIPAPKQNTPAKVTATVVPAPAVVAPVPQPPPVTADLKEVRNFALYTSQVNPVTVAKTGYDMVIVNEANKDSVLFTKNDVAMMKSTGKVVLAEVSVGRAEAYRWYWDPSWNDSKPVWMGEEVTKNVHYVKQWWHPEWWRISTGIIDRAIAAGYDGVVLDSIDTYIELGASKAMRDKMVDYVIALSQYAKKQQKGFLIVVKNAEILGNIVQYTQYVDGIVKENLVFSAVGSRNPDAQIVKSARDLAEFKKSGLPVFIVEYVSGENWTTAKARIRNNGFIGYSAPSRSPSVIRENTW